MLRFFKFFHFDFLIFYENIYGEKWISQDLSKVFSICLIIYVVENVYELWSTLKWVHGFVE